MTGRHPPFDPVLEPLLARGKIIRRVADVVRARSLARARATVAAAVISSPEPVPARWRRALPIAVAASLALAAGAAGAVVTLRSPAPQGLVPASPPRPASVVSAPGRALGAPSPEPEAAISPECEVPAKPQRPPRLSPQESYAAELKLLGRAQAAYGRGSFAEALAVVTEHGRSFPNGRLAEEREALRVRSLAGAGRSDEAARAAAAFADRFPRSVLLPRLYREPR